MFEIWDEQTGLLLAEGLADMTVARGRLDELLGDVRRQVEATGDSIAGMVLQWEIRDAATGAGVAWHWGEPGEYPGHQ
ncbi:hypothetical protein [Nocardiopsis dassonvillei]|uniref:hypothetical protein n=1 Tax=Nocardiopsis dassonvillei TaxID=2014 RepID=UPI0036399DEB